MKKTSPVVEKHQERAEVSSAPITQVGRMRAAVAQAVAEGPSFLRGDVDADHMAKTMIRAVRHYVEQERAAGGDGAPQNAEARALQDTIGELMGCGSGYLAGQCDADCVARTMTEMVHQFAAR